MDFLCSTEGVLSLELGGVVLEQALDFDLVGLNFLLVDIVMHGVGKFQVSHFSLQLRNLLDLIPQHFVRLGDLKQLLTQLRYLIFQIKNPRFDLCFGLQVPSSVPQVREPVELVLPSVALLGYAGPKYTHLHKIHK